MPEFCTTEFALVAGMIALAAFVQGTLGFGAGLTSMAMLPLVISPKVAIPLVTVCAIPITVIILWQCRKSVRFQDVRLVLPSLLLAVPFGVYVLSALPAEVVRRIIGGLILLTAGHMLFGRIGHHERVGAGWAIGAGAGTGALGGAFNVGGPPMLFFLLLHDWDKDRIRGDFALLGTVNIASRLLLYRFGSMQAEPLLTDSILRGGLLLLPGVVVGTLLGVLASSLLSRKLFRRLVLAALGVLGAVLIVG